MIMNDSITAMIDMMKVMFIVIFIGHWLACLFFAIGSMELMNYRDCWLRKSELVDSHVDA